MAEIQVKISECEKMAKVIPDSQKLGEFLDWLDEQGIVLARYEDDTLAQDYTRRENLLAKYFDIDLKKVEEERCAMLNQLARNHQEDEHAVEQTKA